MDSVIHLLNNYMYNRPGWIAPSVTTEHLGSEPVSLLREFSTCLLFFLYQLLLP